MGTSMVMTDRMITPPCRSTERANRFVGPAVPDVRHSRTYKCTESQAKAGVTIDVGACACLRKGSLMLADFRTRKAVRTPQSTRQASWTAFTVRPNAL